MTRLYLLLQSTSLHYVCNALTSCVSTVSLCYLYDADKQMDGWMQLTLSGVTSALTAVELRGITAGSSVSGPAYKL